jgi:hypothetical protein
MTHFSDPIRNGAAGLAPDTRQTPGTLSGAPGVNLIPIKYYAITPATGSTTALAASQSTAAALSLTAGIGVTATTVNGTTAYDLGCQRAVTISGNTGVSQVNFTIQGWDDYQTPLTATISGPNGNTTVTTTKTFRYVQSITPAAGTGSGVTAGTADTFGFPVRVDNFGDICGLTWGNTGVTALTGFTAAVTSTATATTGDIRGTYAVQSAADGAKKLIAFIGCPSTDTVTQIYGVAQYSA